MEVSFSCQSPTSKSRSLQKTFFDAQFTGVIRLAGRKLKEFPIAPSGCDLTDTTFTDVSRNQLSEVPVGICNFESLEHLDCSQNIIRSIPQALAQLDRLVHLNISRNQLSVLPACVCHLKSLQVLLVTNNKLKGVPADIRHLTALMELDVSCNRISHLPAEMGSMRSLRKLNVRRNRLKDLPPELGQAELTRLDVSRNLLTIIPVEFCTMGALEELNLEYNPLICPPAHIIAGGLAYVLKHLQRTAQYGSHMKRKSTSSSLASSVHQIDVADRPEDGVSTVDDLSSVDELHRLNGCGVRHADSGYSSNGRMWMYSPEAQSDVDDAIISSTHSSNADATPVSSIPSTTSLPELSLLTLSTQSLSPGEQHTSDMAMVHITVNGDNATITTGDAGIPAADVPATDAGDMFTKTLFRHRRSYELKKRQAQQYKLESTSSLEKDAAKLKETIKLAQVSHSSQRDDSSKYSPLVSSLSLINLKTSSSSDQSKFASEITNNTVSTMALVSDKSPDLVRDRPVHQLCQSVCDTTTGDQLPVSKLAFLDHHSPPTPSTATVAMPPHVPELPVDISGFATWPRSSSLSLVKDATVSQSRKGLSVKWCLLTVEDDDRKRLRQIIERVIDTKLPDDLHLGLCDGVVLCQLANRICPSIVAAILEPSPASSLPIGECRLNIECFILACRKMGVTQAKLCCVDDVLVELNADAVFQTVETLVSLPGFSELDRAVGLMCIVIFSFTALLLAIWPLPV